MQNELREKIQAEALAELMKYKRRSAAISMRVGKTLIGIKVAAAKWTEIINQEFRNARILVVAPKLSIFDSWKEDLNKFNYEYLHGNIDYTTYISFNRLDLSKYDLIIFDECHSLKYSHQTSNKLSDYTTRLPHYKGDILGLTGTPPISKYSEKYKMMDSYCPVKYTYETEEAIDAEILNDYRIIVHMIPLSEEKNIHIKKGKWDFWTSEKKSYESLSKKIIEAGSQKDKQWAAITRMKQMQNFPSKEKYAKELMTHIGDKCLVFANTKDQADRLCTHSVHSGNTSSEANLQLFKAGVIDELSCVLQLSEGITIPGLKASIVLHAYGNEVKFPQRFARCLSLSTDDMSNVHVLVYKDTVDMEWVQKSFASLDQSKIKYVDFKEQYNE